MSTVDPVAYELGQIRRFWWLTLLTGVLSVIAGIIVLIKPGNSLVTLAVIAGIFILVNGVFELVAAIFSNVESRGMVGLLGALNAVIGIILIRHPISGIVAIAMLIGLWLIVIGGLRLVQAVQYGEGRIWHIVLGLVNILAGIVIVSDASIGLATLALIAGIGFLLNGIMLIIAGVAARQIEV